MRSQRSNPEPPAKKVSPAVRGFSAREIVGSPRSNGGALLVEKRPRWACDLCDRPRFVAVTVLVPMVRGHSRPRFDTEAQPTVTVCWRCLLRRVVRVLLLRRPKGAA